MDALATTRAPRWHSLARAPARLAAGTWSREVNRVHRHVLPRLGLRAAYMVGFSAWKQTWLRRYFRDRALVFLSENLDSAGFESAYRAEILARDSAEFFVWGVKAPAFVLAFAQRHGIAIRFVEDGFVRSSGLGASKAAPMSLCLDSRAPYFSAREPSDLETLLGRYDFAADGELMRRAGRGIAMLIESGVSKYNHVGPIDIESLYGRKREQRVLVLGQVEDDASIRYGCDRALTNNDVVRLAAAENPDAQIIYKPHPDVLSGHRPAQSDPDDVRHLSRVITLPLPLAQALETIDHVYTISSLGGFEALMRGLRVTTLGCPFYSGWGLTDDRQPNARRQRQLTVREVFAAAYLLYPRYFEPASGEPLSFEAVVRRLRAPQAARPEPTPLPLWPIPQRNALSLYVP